MEVLIIGAGISGLIVARELSKAGMQVSVLEARKRTGGRIHTTKGDEFPVAAETGAEFIHGRLPHTIKLLKQYGIKFPLVKGKFIQLKNNVFKNDADFIGEYDALLKRKLEELEEDIPVKQFLEENFPGEEFHSLYNSVRKFVEGYDTGDITRASTFEFRKEWSEMKDPKQYRVEGGYGQLTNALESECKMNGCTFHFSAEVKKISWEKNEAEILCADGKKFTAQKVVITVPLGVLQSDALKFEPALPEKEYAANQLGFGEVIKVLLYFSAEFWKKKEIQERTGENFKRLFFVSSNAPVPTWWTQYPSEKPLLTGWLSGSAAKERKQLSDEKILQECITSLAIIFKESEEYLENTLQSWKINNWSNDPFTRGSYAYATVDAGKHIETLRKPVEEILFFAGEAYSPGTGSGLVESAIVSGFETAKEIISTV